MSTKPKTEPTPRRIRQLRSVEDDLRELAEADNAYSPHAKRMLAELEAYEDGE